MLGIKKTNMYDVVFQSCITRDDMNACYTGLVRCLIEEKISATEIIQEMHAIEDAFCAARALLFNE